MSLTERIYWLDARIRFGSFPNADHIVEKFEVSRRTAYSDKSYLADRLGAPIARDRVRGGWYYSDPNYVLPFLAITQPEARALSDSLLVAREYLGAAESEAIGKLASRLGGHVPGLEHTEGASAGGSIRLAPGISVSSELLSDCHQAIAENQKLSLLYYSPRRDGVTERVVQPYHLHNYQGEWHLVAWCEWRRDFRQFFLGRVREWSRIKVSGSFQRDAAFDIETYLSRGFGLLHGQDMVEVRVRFSPYQSRWIRERVYHANQQTEELADGSVILTLRVAGTSEVLRWILSFGPDVEVLDPQLLRDQVAEAAKKTSEIYDKEP